MIGPSATLVEHQVSSERTIDVLPASASSGPIVLTEQAGGRRQTHLRAIATGSELNRL